MIFPKLEKLRGKPLRDYIAKMLGSGIGIAPERPSAAGIRLNVEGTPTTALNKALGALRAAGKAGGQEYDALLSESIRRSHARFVHYMRRRRHLIRRGLLTVSIEWSVWVDSERKRKF